MRVKESAIARTSKPRRLGGQSYDPGVGILAGDGFLRELNKMADIPGDEGTPLPRGAEELLPVGHLAVPHLGSADSVQPALAQGFSDPGREVLIQIELHAVRPRRGMVAWAASRARASFSAMSFQRYLSTDGGGPPQDSSVGVIRADEVIRREPFA